MQETIAFKRTLLQENNARKPIIQIPEVDTSNTTLVVEFPVNIERFVRGNLQPSHSLARYCAIVERWVEFIAPGRSVAVAITVVITEEVIPLRFGAATDLERLVDGGQKVFSKVWDNGRNGLQILLCIAGVQPPEKVAAGSIGVSGRLRAGLGLG